MPLEELWEPGAARRIPGRPTPEMPSVTSHLRVEWVDEQLPLQPSMWQSMAGRQ